MPTALVPIFVTLGATFTAATILANIPTLGGSLNIRRPA